MIHTSVTQQWSKPTTGQVNPRNHHMAQSIPSSAVAVLHRIQPHFGIGPPLPRLLNPCASRSRSRRFRTLGCQIQNSTGSPDSSTSTSTSEKLPSEPGSVNNIDSQARVASTSTGFPEFPDKTINKQVALVSVLGAIGLFLSTRLDLGVSLKDLSAAALPYEEALSNGKPTVVEFYADWCEVCRELAPDVYKVEQQYKDRVNFVMLNVDNTKWEQELDEFGVEGIPHFAFLDRDGNEEGNVVGKFPRQYLLENVDALAIGEASIPHSRIVGQYSSAEARQVHQVVDPRSHG